MNLKRAGKTLHFYTIFYVGLFGFSAACQSSNGSIGSNPGLSFGLIPPDGTTLISYKRGDNKSVEYWIKNLDDFLKPYDEQIKYENIDNCENKDKPEDKKFCKFDHKQGFGPCIKNFNYGLGNELNGGLCIFLKLDKIYGWQPEYYTNNDTLPSNMAKYLREYIIAMSGKDHLVWVDCAGENPADIENIGPISYYPQWGFQAKYFPFKNVEGYVSPLVAVRFEKPKRGVLINIECKAWARNIHHDRKGKRGLVHFELLVD